MPTSDISVVEVRQGPQGPAGANGTNGTDAEVTAAAVQTALAAAPTQAKTSAKVFPILENQDGLAEFFDRIMRLDEATESSPVAVMMAGFSDSMPGYVGQQLVMDLAERFGLAALCSPEFGLSWNGAAASVVLTGSAAAVTNDYTALPNSGEINLPAGGKYSLAVPDFGLNPAVLAWIGSGDTDEYAMSSGRRPIALPHGITKVTVFYKMEPGAGDITGTLLQTGLSNVTSTVAAAGTLALGTMELTPADAFAPLTIEVSAATAAVRMLGIVFWTGGSGVGYWSSAKGSTKMDDQLPGLVAGEWNAVYTSLFAALNTGLVIHAQRASDAGDEANNYQARYADFFDAYETLGASQLVFGEPSREPLSENALTTDTINAFLRAECATRGIAYCNRKTLVPATSPFKDTPTDGIHRDPREHRYVVGRLLAAAGYFRSAYSRFGGSDLTKGDLAAERFRCLAAGRARTRDFIGQGGFTYFNTTWTGAGFGNPTATSDTGFNFATAAGVAGHSAAVFGLMPGGASQLDTTLGDIVVSANGYRNLNLPAGGGHSAALIFGQSSTIITNITSITTRCFGIEFQHGTDIGGGLGAAEYMRIFAHNGTSMTYGRWVLCNTASGTPSANGITIMLHWQRQRQRLVLWGNGNNLGFWPRASLSVPALAANATASAWAQGYIRTSGTGHTAGKMQWQHISCTFGEISLPYAL